MTSRKDFLLASTVAAAALPAVAEAAPDSPPAKVVWPKFEFDLATFNAQLDGPQPHKHLFSSVDIEQGTIFAMVRNTMMAYNDLGVPASSVMPAAVLYHGTGVLLGFDDHVWDAYVIPFTKKAAAVPKLKGAIAQIEGIVGSNASGNPSKAGVAKLATDAGLRLYLCNEATRGFATVIAGHLNLPALDVYRDIAAHVLPNAMLTPTGVWAMHAVQEHHFTLLPVTVRASD